VYERWWIELYSDEKVEMAAAAVGPNEMRLISTINTVPGRHTVNLYNNHNGRRYVGKIVSGIVYEREKKQRIY